MLKNKFLILFCSVLLSLLMVDVLLGHIGFLKKTGEISSILHLIKTRILRTYDTGIVEIVSTESNPFMSYSPKDSKIFYRFHPFIDYTRVHAGKEPFTLDYFGFRNNEDIYFKNKDYVLVVMSGGSELAGVSHTTSIAQNLEKFLNENGKQKFKVLNLGMNSYTISNEINAYVNLAYHLKPEFVITYSGWNDLFYGMMVPYNFKKLGLNYFRYQELWLPRLYNLKESTGSLGSVFNEKGIEVIVDAYLKNVEKYNSIVSSMGGGLIVGIQGYNKHIVFDKERAIDYKSEQQDPGGKNSRTNLLYEKIYYLYQELTRKASEMGYIDFTKFENIRFVDNIHSTDESSVIIAKVFAEKILSELHGKEGWNK